MTMTSHRIVPRINAIHSSEPIASLNEICTQLISFLEEGGKASHEKQQQQHNILPRDCWEDLYHIAFTLASVSSSNHHQRKTLQELKQSFDQLPGAAAADDEEEDEEKEDEENRVDNENDVANAATSEQRVDTVPKLTADTKTKRKEHDREMDAPDKESISREQKRARKEAKRAKKEAKKERKTKKKHKE